MDDLKARLRKFQSKGYSTRPMHEAADRIASLESELKAAREALEPFAEIAKEIQPELGNDVRIDSIWACPKVGDLRRARAALNQGE